MPIVELKILFDLETSKITNISGPIQNKAVCYGILESAKDKIREFDPAKQSPIIQARGIVPKNGQS